MTLLPHPTSDVAWRMYVECNRHWNMTLEYNMQNTLFSSTLVTPALASKHQNYQRISSTPPETRQSVFHTTKRFVYVHSVFQVHLPMQFLQLKVSLSKHLPFTTFDASWVSLCFQLSLLARNFFSKILEISWVLPFLCVLFSLLCMRNGVFATCCRAQCTVSHPCHHGYWLMISDWCFSFTWQHRSWPLCAEFTTYLEKLFKRCSASLRIRYMRRSPWT